MTGLFLRTDLAERYAEALVDPSPTSSVSSGLFLAAPRRTGKSTFLREDLVPALERREVLVIYVDLWKDRSAEPSDVIGEAVRAALEARAGATGLIRRLGIDEISVAGVTVARSGIGPGSPLSLSAALEALSEQGRRPIALLIDEAQHASTSDAGTNALFALKAARDELNGSRYHGLRIVATGSNRDKLAGLVGSKAQAFYRATLVDLPPLGEGYVRWFVDQQRFGDELDAGEVLRLFERSGHQPELLNQAADRLTLEEPGTAATGLGLGERLAVHLDAVIAADENELVDAVSALAPLERAVLAELAVVGGRFAPFGKASLERYRERLGEIGDAGTRSVGTSGVQKALAALQASGLVWRSARGAYALEERRLAELMRREGLL